MKRHLYSLVILTALLSLSLEAANDKYLFPIDQALTKHSDAVAPNIKLYFATQSPEGEPDNLGTYTSKKRPMRVSKRLGRDVTGYLSLQF